MKLMNHKHENCLIPWVSRIQYFYFERVNHVNVMCQLKK